jgi:tetratricopeptide (TPR) repeat protein/SAM-dependent methyltransferase
MADIEAAKKCFYEGLAFLDAHDYPNCEIRLRQALQHLPHNVSVLSNLAVALLLQGKLTEARSTAETIIARDAGNTGAYLVIAECLTKSNQFADLVAIYDKIIAIEPNSAEHHSNRGAALIKLARYQDALASCDRAIALQTGLAAAHHNRANSLVKLGRHDDAVLSYDRALSLDPTLDHARVGRCHCLAILGRSDEAIAQLRDLVRLKPDHAAAHGILGAAYAMIGDSDLTAHHCRQSLMHDPRNHQAMLQLAEICLAQGDNRQALDLASKALDIEETPRALQLFIQAARNAQIKIDGARFAARLRRGFAENWDRPDNLMWPALGLIKRMNNGVRTAIERQTAAMPRFLSAAELCGTTGLAEIANDVLLRELIRVTPICDREFEQLLTALRWGILDLAANETAASVTEDVLHFACALAQQCFVNEYVYAATDEEQSQVAALAERLATAAADGADVPPLWAAAVGAYLPLHAMRSAEQLLKRAWPAPVAAVLRQQIAEPSAQRELRASLPSLTTVENSTSIEVKRQYEENPYPRWITVGSLAAPRPFDAFMRSKFPQAYKPLGKTRIDVLIAGCGTGRQAIEMSQSFLAADVLAIDLSAASLSYALHKTRELGLTNVQYAVADILQLDSLGRSFDLIETTGVLHHLADPLAGWRRLLSIVRPGGVMRLGFYSELARQSVVRARTLIAERGYPATAEGIRRCRQEMLRSDDPLLKQATECIDFFSMSECRDLLFHVQEHRVTLPQLAAFMEASQVTFLGFDADSTVFKAYESRFPEDKWKTDLASWHQFELENPESFTGMYQFWIQKPRSEDLLSTGTEHRGDRTFST